MAEAKKYVENYRYAIFPTFPQRRELQKILRQARLQWNRAVTIRKKLKSALRSGQIRHVVKSCLSIEKNNGQGARKKAIEKFAEQSGFSFLSFADAGKLYDIKNKFGRIIEVSARHLDIDILISEVSEKLEKELRIRREAERKNPNTEKPDLPKLPTYWGLVGAIGTYAGEAAKKYMDDSFSAPAGSAYANIRCDISGYAKSQKWNTAVKPSADQRAYGAKGEPRYKKRDNIGFGYPVGIKTKERAGSGLIREKKRSLVYIRALPEGMREVPIVYHREIPETAEIKRITIKYRAGRYFLVASAGVPAEVFCRIEPKNAGVCAGIDPGAKTALTVALQNRNTGERGHILIDYRFLERSLERLEKLQQKFAKQEKKSKRWFKSKREISRLHLRVWNQRNDALHKVSRFFAEGFDFVGIGDWEPPREVGYRKRLRKLQKQVRAGIKGAEKRLAELKEDKKKNGPKGVRKGRRGARDRAIATLRGLVSEKMERSGGVFIEKVKENYSTIQCSACGEHTGPRGQKDLSVRFWKCKNCGTEHNRDVNAGMNILASAQEAAKPETEARKAVRRFFPGETERTGDSSRSREKKGKTAPNFLENIYNLFGGEPPKVFNSLILQGIIGFEDMLKCSEMAET